MPPLPEESKSQDQPKDTQSKKKQGALAVLGLTQDPGRLSLDDELKKYFSVEAQVGMDILAFWHVSILF